jgi:probable rRNA maturation factor
MVAVEITKEFKEGPGEAEELQQLAREVCRRYGVSDAAVSIGIVGDAAMGALNRRFRGHEDTTDCLSFDLSDGPETSGTRVFDLIVNGELASREAAQRGHSGRAELALYVVHGLLHNLGFDDGTDAESAEMHRTEDEILKELGYGVVYNHGTRAH